MGYVIDETFSGTARFAEMYSFKDRGGRNIREEN